MRSQRGYAGAILACCLTVVLFARPAYAYIDPNAAGLVSQILTPVLVFAAAGLTFFRKRLADLFSGFSRRSEPKQDGKPIDQD